jgi:hypothetical protein
MVPELPDPPPAPTAPAVAVSTSTPPAVNAPPAPEDPELAALRDIYQRQMLKLETANRTNTLNWARAYSTTIETLRKNMQEAGDLDGWVAAGRELERFQADGTPPGSIGVTGSYALDAALVDARQRYDKLADAHSESVVSLGDNYISHLLAIQSRRTRDGDFRAAMRVNKEIKRVQKSPARSAAEFRLAATAARRSVESEPSPATTSADAENGKASPPASPAVPVLSEPAISKGRVRTPLPGVTFERLSVKPGGSARSRRNFEVSVMRGISSNLHSRASSDLQQTDSTRETALRHHVVVGLRTTSRTHIIKQPRIRIEYFVTGIGPAEGRSAPRRVTVDEVDLDTLDNEWVYIDCPPVETRQFTQSFEGNTFRRQSAGGERFHGVIVTVLQSRKRPVFEAVAAAAP